MSPKVKSSVESVAVAPAAVDSLEVAEKQLMSFPSAKKAKAPKAKKAARDVVVENVVKGKAVKTPKAAKKTEPEAEGKPKKERNYGGISKEEREDFVLSHLLKLGAVSGSTAVTAEAVVKSSKGKLTLLAVYSACRHRLADDGLTAKAKIEGARGLCYYLTAKGKKLAG